MSPLEALLDTIDVAVIGEQTRRHPKPGAIVQRMSPKHRAALSQLTSEDTQKLRMDLFWDEEYEARCTYGKMLTDFDRKLRVDFQLP